MKKTLKTLFSLALALALVLSMAPAVAASYIADADTELSNYKVTITLSNVVSGDTLTAYKLVCYDANNSYNSYALADSFNTFVTTKNSVVPTISNVEYLESLGEDEIAALINEFAEEVSKGTYALPAPYASVDADSTTVDMELEPGYYLILGSTTAENGSVYMPAVVFVQLLNGEVNVFAGYNSEEVTKDQNGKYAVAMKRSDAPSADKTVKDSDGDDTLGYTDTATAGVGDTVSFQLTVTIPKYANANSVELVLKDTLTNLEYVVNSIHMYSTNTSGTLSGEITNGATTYYSVVAGTYDNGEQTLTITLNYDKLVGDADRTVYITYNATVTADAAVTDTATNSVKVTYTVNNEEKTTTETTTTVYAYALKVTKTDENGEPLTGAKFKVYTEQTGGTAPLTFSYDDVNNCYYPDADGTVTEIEADFLIKGLDEGTYYLEESTVPSGYSAPSGRFAVTLKAEQDGSGNNEYTGDLDGTDSSASAVANADSGLISSASVSTPKSQYDVTIKNSSMADLPSTGGVGTAMFTVGGIALMALAAWLFFSRRKESAR